MVRSAHPPNSTRQDGSEHCKWACPETQTSNTCPPNVNWSLEKEWICPVRSTRRESRQATTIMSADVNLSNEMIKFILSDVVGANVLQANPVAF